MEDHVLASPMVLRPEKFVPRNWTGDPTIRILNPSILRHAGLYLICYRVVGVDLGRRFAIARLNERLEVFPDSILPVSDLIEFANGASYTQHSREWWADPRLFEIGGRIYVIWNDGIPATGRNHQYVIQIDPITLRPIGWASEIRLAHGQHRIEKNWMLLDNNGVKILYSHFPLSIYSVENLENEQVLLSRPTKFHWNYLPYIRRFGQLRGGAQPVKRGGSYYSIGHSSYPTADGKRYSAAVLKFQAEAPHRVEAISAAPLLLPQPPGTQSRLSKLNPASAEVIFPGGAVLDGDDWLISYGINDEYAVICRISHASIENSLVAAATRSALWDFLCRGRNYLLMRFGWPLPCLDTLLEMLR